MGRPVVTTVVVAAAVATGYALAQSLGSAGNLTLNGSLVSGGVGTPANPARPTVASVGDDSGITFTFTGTIPDPANPGGTVAYSEIVAGTNAGNSTPAHDFATITNIAASGATAANVTAGTTETASGPWVPWDANVRTKFEVSAAGVVVAGSPTWQVDLTYDDIYNNPNTPTVFVDGDLTGKTGNAAAVIANPGVRASRLTVVVAGTVTLTQTQQGD